MIRHLSSLQASSLISTGPVSNNPLVEPDVSPFWTDPACTTVPAYAVSSPDDKLVAGLIAQQPGKLWSSWTTANRSYFEEITYVKVPALSWSDLKQPVQFHHGLVSVSDKEVSADGWSRFCMDGS